MRNPGAEFSGLRRARPLLGTIVEIRVDRGACPDPDRAVATAFDEVSRIEELMGRDHAQGDLARLNAAPIGQPIVVDQRTAAVLRWCRILQAQSAGLFDVTASLTPGITRAPHPVGWRIAGVRALRTAPVRLDLDGIAKGYAVDRAVAVLERCGITAGAVCAGGDLRLFGSLGAQSTVTVRLPVGNQGLRLTVDRPCAFATSARFPAAAAAADLAPGEIVDPQRGRAIDRPIAVTIQARTCLLADALTKIVAIDPGGSAPCLDRYQAAGWLTDFALQPPRVECRLPQFCRRPALHYAVAV
jgi:FAD:protein FMN transferase